MCKRQTNSRPQRESSSGIYGKATPKATSRGQLTLVKDSRDGVPSLLSRIRQLNGVSHLNVRAVYVLLYLRSGARNILEQSLLRPMILSSALILHMTCTAARLKRYQIVSIAIRLSFG